jgi:hypothetical protein
MKLIQKTVLVLGLLLTINIGNAAVPQNGTLNVTFKARKQN